MSKKTHIELICLIILICIITIIVWLLATSKNTKDTDNTSEVKTVSVVRLIGDVKKGEEITAQNVELVKVPDVNIPSNAFLSLDDVYSRYAKNDLYAGNYIYKGQISTNKNVMSSNSLKKQEIKKSNEKFVVVTDYIKPNTGEDIRSHLQALIDSNPGRTLYFPDGEYVISSSLITNPYGPESTTFFLADNAVIKASDDWRAVNSKKALICIGGKYISGQHVNDNTSNGSYFGVIGGVLDGNDVADGISVDSSRESIIYDICIKNAVNGIVIKSGANNKSSDADIENVTIIGSGKSDTIGINIIGYDNTVTDVKIYDMEIGMKIQSAANSLRNVSIYNSETVPNYLNTIGFEVDYMDDFFYNCYTENVATAYFFKGTQERVLMGLRARWTYDAPKQTMFVFDYFNSKILNSRADFHGVSGQNSYIDAKNYYELGKIDTPIFDTTLETSKQYEKCLTSNGLIDLSKAE